jgi:hypothetical protein
MFILEKTMPNGAIAKYHKAVKLEVREDSTHAVVNSYHAEDMSMISWQDTYSIPLSIQVETLADVEYILTYPGAPFDGGVIVPDDTATLDTKKARLLGELRLTRDKEQYKGTSSPKGPIDTDSKSQSLISSFVSQAQSDLEFTVNWTMKDDSIVAHNSSEFIELHKAMVKHIEDVHYRYTDLKAEINNATSIEELDSIDIYTGWPA